MREKFLYPKFDLHKSHAEFSPQTRFERPNERYASVDKPRNPRKSYNDKLQRTYEDFEIETDDSVVEIEKAPATHGAKRESINMFGHKKFVKSLSPQGRTSSIFDRESVDKQKEDFYQTKSTFKMSQNNQNMASFSRMTQFKTLKNKAQSVLEKSNYLRRKHFKGDTLHKGEGRLFMTKGLSN